VFQQRGQSRHEVMKEEENALKVISSTLRQVAHERKQQNHIDQLRSPTMTDVDGKFVAGELRAITDQYNRDLAKGRKSDVLFLKRLQSKQLT